MRRSRKQGFTGQLYANEVASSSDSVFACSNITAYATGDTDGQNSDEIDTCKYIGTILSILIILTCAFPFYQAAIKGDQLEKAFELASCLNLQRSLQGALKLANVMRKRVLAEKITTLIQNREALIQVQHEMPVHNHSQVSELQSPVGMEAGNTKSRDSALVKVKEEKENVFSRKRSASEMAAPKTPKNPFARS